MRTFFRQLIKAIPTLITAIILAVAVWISAVTSSDPIEENTYPYPVTVEVIGQDPALVLVSNLPQSISVSIKAPRSTWALLNNDKSAVRALLDLSGLNPGTYLAELQVQVGIEPVQVISISPESIEVSLDNLATRNLPITLIHRGELAIGFQASEPVISHTEAVIHGPQTLVNKVTQIRGILDISQAQENINRSITLTALDSQENVINGVTITPAIITVSEDISQRYGYRNVVVKVSVTGQVSSGYRLTNISVSPPAITVFSANPEIIYQLPGYIETLPIDLTGATDDLDIFQPLNLPEGVEVVGEQTTIFVQVSIAAIEGSLPYAGPIEYTGLGPGLTAKISPETVTTILSGPLPRLAQLTPENVRISVDVTGLTTGTYQLPVTVEIASKDLIVESILPDTVEVTISKAATPTGPP